MQFPELNVALLERVVWKNTVLSWLIFIVFTIVLFTTFRFLRWFLMERVLTDERVKNLPMAKAVDIVLQKTRASFLLIFAVYFSGWHLDLGERARRFIDPLMILILLFQFWRWGVVLIEFFVGEVSKKTPEDGAKKTTLLAVTFGLKILLFVTLVILALDRIGINVTPLVAGLGVGGIAVTLALQSILGDVFASIIIVLDRPFVIGDEIGTENLSGTVESIGVKTTRVRSSSGEQLVFPNQNLLQSRIKNFKRMGRRRTLFNLAVKYDTKLATLKEIPAMVCNIIQAHELAGSERCTLINLGDSAIVFEVFYWINSPDAAKALAVNEMVYYEILETFEKRGISLAFPTREIIVHKADSEIETG